jgi:transcription-repair coupling factor (superfamily II helicase)
MLTQPHKHLTPQAARRLRAIEEFSEMGAGFAIAMRDLEIRGAGNLLGTQQSGHINAVGYELYCTLLENAVRTLQKLPPRLNLEVDVNLPGEAYLPADYVDDMRLKIDLYRRLTRITQYGDLDDFRAELTDRFGPIPEQTERLLRLAELKMDAVVWQVNAIYIEKKFIVFKYLDRRRIEQLSRQHKGKLRVVDNESAYWPIAGDENDGDYLLQVLKAVLKPANTSKK